VAALVNPVFKLNGHTAHPNLKGVLARLPTELSSQIEELQLHLWRQTNSSIWLNRPSSRRMGQRDA
jgi:hypothetical protein